MDERGWTLAPGLQAFAVPAGTTPRVVYEALRDELLADLDALMPLDAVMLFLHGAMIADGYDDCEGDILARVRARVGPNIPIGAELDLHCHVTSSMLETADVLVGYKHYPHTDTYDRLIDLFEIVADTAEGKVRPTMASAACRMIGMYHTTREPMSGFVDRMYALEREPGVLNVWLAHGFPYGDVPSIGAHVVVATDNDPAKARELARSLRDRVLRYAQRSGRRIPERRSGARPRRLQTDARRSRSQIRQTIPAAARRAIRRSSSAHCSTGVSRTSRSDRCTTRSRCRSARTAA